MKDLREVCDEWLDEISTNETDLEDLVTFVQAQRLDAARKALDRATQMLCYSGLEPSKDWNSVVVAAGLRAIRDSIEREGA
jgi:hypothetical protein